jgi:hypothetical protein
VSSKTVGYLPLHICILSIVLSILFLGAVQELVSNVRASNVVFSFYFRWLFEDQVLCSVSGSWALYKNLLQMEVAKIIEHVYFLTCSCLHGQATTAVGEGFFAAWGVVVCSSYCDQNRVVAENFLYWQSTRLSMRELHMLYTHGIFLWLFVT